jgi:hypothetical protein
MLYLAELLVQSATDPIRTGDTYVFRVVLYLAELPPRASVTGQVIPLRPTERPNASTTSTTIRGVELRGFEPRTSCLPDKRSPTEL